MTAVILKPRVRREINGRVDKILQELGYPEPPLQLDVVRELLALDRSYFSTEANGLLRKTFSRLRRGGKQILNDPTVLIDAIKKFDLRALYIPDQNRILIDDSIPKPKHRWLEAHEIGHSFLPWHQDMLLGDDEITPTPATHDKMEAEANFAAGSLIFLNERFSNECKDIEPSINNAQMLWKRYGNTLTTTFWRMLEHIGESRPLIGLIGPHPRQMVAGSNFRHVIPSSAFDEQFSELRTESLVKALQSYSWGKRGPIGTGEFVLTARTGARHTFHFETFFNNYDALTLGVHLRALPKVIQVGGLSPVAI